MQTEAFAAEAEPFFTMLHSVDLVAPPLTLPEYAALAVYLNAGWGPARPERRIRLHLPSARDEKRLAVPPYGRSYFELVRRAFQRRGEGAGADPAEGAITCRSRSRAALAEKWDPWRAAPRTELVPIGWSRLRPPAGQGPLTQIDLVHRSDVGDRLRAILARPTPAGPGAAPTS
jgi:hypothetical protein